MPKLSFNHMPTQEEIREALKDVPAWPGAPDDKNLGSYAHHILPMERKGTWNLYPLVDGRVRMFTDAHATAGKGYRETIECVEVFQQGKHNLLVVRMSIDSDLFGRREDAATANLNPPSKNWADAGAKGVDITNPYENVMTSVRGRVIAAFGVGIIPAQGLASAEEMQEARRRGEEEERSSRPPAAPARQSPPAKSAPRRAPAQAKQSAPPQAPAAQSVQQRPAPAPTPEAPKAPPPAPAPEPQSAPTEEPPMPPPPDDEEAPPEPDAAEPEVPVSGSAAAPSAQEPSGQYEALVQSGGSVPTEEAVFYLELPKQQDRNFLRVSLCKLYGKEPREKPDMDQWNTLHGLVCQYAQQSGITHDVQQWETLNFSGFMKWCEQQGKGNA